MKTKVAYILSDYNKTNPFDWIVEGLRSAQLELVFILINNRKDTPLEKFLSSEKIKFYRIESDQSKKVWLLVLIKILFALLRERPKVIHTHLHQATLLGLFAGKLLRIPKRFYTRHHSTYHYKYFRHGVKTDKLLNKLSTGVISISKNVEQVLLEKDLLPAKKNLLIYHGFPINQWNGISQEKARLLKSKYGFENAEGPIVGVISRYVQWKGIQYILPAFKKFLSAYPDAKLILANAKGDYLTELHSLIDTLEVKNSIVEIVYEEDIIALYKCFDVFVHVPVDSSIEAFGQTYIEALITKTPMVCTMSGIAAEVITSKNAHLVPYEDVNSIYEGMLKITVDTSYRQKLLEEMSKTDLSLFTIERHVQNLLTIYS